MHHAAHLRLRLLTSLAASGLLAASAGACGGNTESDGSGGGGPTGGTTSSGGAGSGGTSTGGAAGTSTGGTSSGGSGGTGGTTTSCAFGSPVEQCFSLAELEAMINNPPQGGDVGDAGADAWISVTDCLDKGQVIDSCCNPATTGPEKKNGACCYVFCDGACCGRPFVVEGDVRVAAECGRSDWLTKLSSPEALDQATRDALRLAWLRDAKMEHASIGSFARFVLELLAVGAPPELLSDAQRAGEDEVDHAKLCFSLAVRYGSEPIGPSGLPVSGALPRATLAESAAAAVREGCIGETIAALVAREQCALATDPEARRALERIAADEERHAELAWSFVRWALGRGDPAVAPAVEQAFSAGIRSARTERAESVSLGVDQDAWRAHGRLSQAALDEVLGAALDEVVLPCSRALFG